MQFLLWLRTAKLNKAGTAPVYLRIFLDGNTRTEYATNIRCRPDRWQGGERKIKGADQATKLLNDALDDLKAKARLRAGRLQAAVDENPDLPPVMPADVARALRPRKAPALLLPTLRAALATFSPKASSRATAGRALNWLAKWPPGAHLPLPGFTQERATAWCLWLREQPLSAGSLQTYISLVAAVLAHACPSYPKVLARQRRGLSGQQKPRRALPADWQQQLAALDLPRAQAVARDVLLLQYLLHGSRVGVVLELTWQQVDELAGRVRFTTHKRPVQKNIVLRPELVALLDKYRGRTGPFVLPLLPADYFSRCAEERLRAMGNATAKVNMALRNIAKRANLGHLHTHLARHTLALRAYEVSGNDLRLPQQLLGHTSIAITAAYINGLTNSELDQAAANVYDNL